MINGNRPNGVTGWFVMVLVLSLVMVGGCTSSGEQQTEETREEGIPVQVHTVQTETLEETVQAVGTLQASQTVRISPEIAGRIEEITFTEGERVSRGDTLVQLDDDRLRQQYEARRHSLSEARANRDNARQTFERNERLIEEELISEQEYDNSRTALESARARVQQLEAQVEEAREQLEDATIHAPYAGIMGSREVDSGNYVQPGTVVSVLYRLDPLEVQFTVPGRFAGRIEPGQTVRVHVSSLPDTTLRGSVTFVSPSIREQTRDLLVKARIDNSNRAAKPGAYARVELTLQTLENRPVIPAEALVGTTEGYILFTVENGEAHRRSVEPGIRRPGLVEIREGLQPGARVVQSGHQNLTDGSRVQIINE